MISLLSLPDFLLGLLSSFQDLSSPPKLEWYGSDYISSIRAEGHDDRVYSKQLVETMRSQINQNVDCRETDDNMPSQSLTVSPSTQSLALNPQPVISSTSTSSPAQECPGDHSTDTPQALNPLLPKQALAYPMTKDSDDRKCLRGSQRHDLSPSKDRGKYSIVKVSQPASESTPFNVDAPYAQVATALHTVIQSAGLPAGVEAFAKQPFRSFFHTIRIPPPHTSIVEQSLPTTIGPAGSPAELKHYGSRTRINAYSRVLNK